MAPEVVINTGISDLRTQIASLADQSRHLEPDLHTRARLFHQVCDYVQSFIECLPQQKGYVKGKLNRLYEFGCESKHELGEVLHVLKKEVDEIGINSASGCHMGYIPGGGLFTSALADLIVAVSNRYAGISYSSPGAVEIENQVIRWLCNMVGYPPSSHGNLTSGGSIAHLTAITVARDCYDIGSENVKRAVVYMTDQTHHSIAKALHITGLGETVQRTIAIDKDYSMDPNALRQQIDYDIAGGLLPFLVVATAGTTNTGSIDPLEEIASIVRNRRIWFHVDAAYGGFFNTVDEVKPRLAGLNHADSIIVDPHKTLFMPYGSGAVLVKEGRLLADTFSHKAGYLKDAYDNNDVDPADTGPELSRHFRGLRIWLPLQLHGANAFSSCLKEKLLLTTYFYTRIREAGLEPGPPPQLTVVIFRVPEDDENTKTQALANALHRDGTVFLSTTVMRDKLWIRCAIVHFRTHLATVDAALEMITKEMHKLNPAY